MNVCAAVVADVLINVGSVQMSCFSLDLSVNFTRCALVSRCDQAVCWFDYGQTMWVRNRCVVLHASTPNLVTVLVRLSRCSAQSIRRVRMRTLTSQVPNLFGLFYLSGTEFIRIVLPLGYRTNLQ